MIVPAEPLRLDLPVAAASAERPAIPVVAVLAPVVVSVVIWLVTSSPLALVFAALGPVVALAGAVDGVRSRRRARRRDRDRLVAALERVSGEIAAQHAAERGRLAALVPHVGVPEWRREGRPVVRLGDGVLPRPVTGAGGEPPADAEVATRLANVVADAAVLDDAPIVADVSNGIVVVGHGPLAAAVVRSAVIQIAGQLSPGEARARGPAGQEWTSGLPHGVEAGAEGEISFVRDGADPVVVRWRTGALPAGGVVIDLTAPAATVRAGRVVVGFRPHALSEALARSAATALSAAADALGQRPAGAGLPERVAFAEVRQEPSRAAEGLSAALGRDGRGVVAVDLAVAGPHAVVGGMTGSGKSELLVTWALGLVRGRRPSEIALLLVDLKGGASFGPLAALPHVLATVTDLDPPRTRRAIESLRAELRRRERVLAEVGARSIDDLGSEGTGPAGLGRLVIMVDEYAVLVTEHPDLAAVFVDLAARGRSLGIHLVLCTQRPSAVVRDAVLANVPLRMSLRMADRAESAGLLGSDVAARLPARPRGRAILVDGEGERSFQVAVASAADLADVLERARADADADAPVPWCDPLPDRIPISSLPPVVSGIPFGRLDLPEEQRQPVAVYDPARDGHLLVLGAAGSGKTTALEALAAAGGATWLPTLPGELWDALGGLAETVSDGLLVLDDLDLVVARCGPDHRTELVEMLATAVRGAPPGRRLVVAAERLGAGLHALAALFPARLLLRQPTRDDHVLAGGAASCFDPMARPGSGTWRGDVVQVALPGGAARVRHPVPGPVTVSPSCELALVTPRGRELRAEFEAVGIEVMDVGAPASGIRVRPPDDRAVVHLGDPEAWQADWELLARARRELPMLLLGCSTTDHRLLTRSRELPPPLDDPRSDGWLVETGRTRRARLEIPTPQVPRVAT